MNCGGLLNRQVQQLWTVLGALVILWGLLDGALNTVAWLKVKMENQVITSEIIVLPIDEHQAIIFVANGRFRQPPLEQVRKR